MVYTTNLQKNFEWLKCFWTREIPIGIERYQC